jgi:hypothetical protein
MTKAAIMRAALAENPSLTAEALADLADCSLVHAQKIKRDPRPPRARRLPAQRRPCGYNSVPTNTLQDRCASCRYWSRIGITDRGFCESAVVGSMLKQELRTPYSYGCFAYRAKGEAMDAGEDQDTGPPKRSDAAVLEERRRWHARFARGDRA